MATASIEGAMPAPSGSMLAILAINSGGSGAIVTWNVTVAASPTLICPAGAPGLCTNALRANGISPPLSTTAAPFNIVLLGT